MSFCFYKKDNRPSDEKKRKKTERENQKRPDDIFLLEKLDEFIFPRETRFRKKINKMAILPERFRQNLYSLYFIHLTISL